MSYSYNDFLTTVKNTLLTGATSTGLWASLTCNYPTITSDSIAIGEPENLPRSIDRYPYIILDLKNTDEEFEQIGISSAGIARMVTNFVDIYAFVQVGSDSQDSDKQARVLARNINTIFRTNYQVNTSSGWDKVVANTTVFKDAYKEPGGVEDYYVSPVRIELEFTKYEVN